MFAKFIAKVDNLIYKSFRIVTPLRRAFWRRASRNIQRELDRQHSIRDFVNNHGYNVSTEEALRIYEELWDRMNENEDGTGSPTPSSFIIQILILTSNNTRRDFNIQNSKIFYIKISLIILILISCLILIFHIIMTINSIIIIFLTVLLGILINLFINRDRTYVVFLKDIQNNVIFTLVVKALNKRKAYEVVSKYLIKQELPFVIGDMTNTAFLNNNDIICSNIYKNKKWNLLVILV